MVYTMSRGNVHKGKGDGYMLRKILGSMLILGLIGILVYNLGNFSSDKQEDNTNQDDLNGGMIVGENQKGVQVDEEAPNVGLKDLDGNDVNLEDFKGEKVFLNFWATWCGPCKKEMPELEKFHQKYQDDVKIVAVNLTKTEKKQTDVNQFIDKYEYTFPVLLDIDGKAQDIYKSVTVPTTYFIGTDGKVQVDKKLGPLKYDEMVSKMKELQ